MAEVPCIESSLLWVPDPNSSRLTALSLAFLLHIDAGFTDNIEHFLCWDPSSVFLTFLCYRFVVIKLGFVIRQCQWYYGSKQNGSWRNSLGRENVWKDVAAVTTDSKRHTMKNLMPFIKNLMIPKDLREKKIGFQIDIYVLKSDQYFWYNSKSP